MKFNDWLGRKRSRPYPIKYDENGLSLRARCFKLFDLGKRPAEVAAELKAKKATVLRYFRDWKKLGPNFDKQYILVRSLFSKNSPERDKNLELFSKTCGIPKEEFEAILSTPHGLRRFLTGKLYFPIQADADHKRHVSLELSLLISDHLIKEKGKFQDVYYALRRWMRQNAAYREQEDIDIEEENKILTLIHRVLAVDLENEQRGRVKPDKLSAEEREALIKFGIESERKKTEKSYWFHIGSLMAGGMSPEEARERMYQDLLKKGDVKTAKAMRQFQDKVHPLKTDGMIEPTSPPPDS